MASSLFCYICDNEHSNWNCMKTYKCEDHEKYCTTTYSTVGMGKDVGHRITKKCSADCPETNVDFGMAAYSTKCCKTSLCNFSGANSIRINYAVHLGAFSKLPFLTFFHPAAPDTPQSWMISQIPLR
ncbi:hypothetical protein EK904_004421 [Melospiza melodia maxima]|nr:hypothetical protein EK904_004421 [Melospiza melodia maxima]